ncbi:SH3 domain-containing protein [Erythrobacter tepidarius]|uniref:SH3 domain-containing protein n=1 Tax=Erythrobacter tepidarius TaxID=60454 RepID=UPI000A3D125F|nr:SH3 domain-containing protein [Erythrobacter tepidarius]
MMGFRFYAGPGLGLLAGAMITATPLSAQDREVPYWAALRYDEVRMRVGPSEEYPIQWVYKRKGLPVKVVRVHEAWRLVEDPEGDKGWIARSQLDPARGVLVQGSGLADIRAEPTAGSALRWRAQPGVVGRLTGCRADWCEVDIGGRKGWIARNRLWGVEDLPGDE